MTPAERPRVGRRLDRGDLFAVARIPLVFSLALVSLETATGLDPLPPAGGSLFAAVLPGLFSACKMLAAFTLLAPAVVVWPARAWGVEPRSSAIALAVAVGGAVAPDRLPSGFSGFLAAACLTVAAFAVAEIWLRLLTTEGLASSVSAVSLLVLLFAWGVRFPLRETARVSPVVLASIYACLLFVCVAPLLRIHRGSRVVILLVVALALTALTPAQVVFSEAFSRRPPAAHVEASPIPRVIVILVDTLRADALSCLNPRAAPTPEIDRLAADSVVFENALSAAPWTLPAVEALLTGVAPYLDDPRLSYRLATLPTLAERFSAAGRFSAAIMGNPLLYRSLAISRGFSDFDVYSNWRLGESPAADRLRWRFPRRFVSGGTTAELTHEATRWLDVHAARPFFLWMHFYDPHDPYAPPERDLPEGWTGDPIGDVPTSGLDVIPQEERTRFEQLYLAEVRAADRGVGALLDELRRRELYEDSLIVLVSDHGEEFWEHGFARHGHSLYQELLHVPLIIKLPGASVRRRIRSYVPTQALAPTLAELCGLKLGEGPDIAASLAPLLTADAPDEYPYPIVGAAARSIEYQRSVVFPDGLKYIRRIQTGREELYDLRADPGERRSLLGEHPEAIERARAVLERHEQRSEAIRSAHGLDSGEQAGGAEMLRKLRSLGYVQ